MKKISPWLYPLALCITVFLLYGFSATPYVNGYADSDELLASGYIGGVAHPPGYPLVVVGTGLFQRLFFWLSPALAGNLFAAFTQSLAVVVITLAGTTLLTHLLPSSQKFRPLLLFGIGLPLATSALVWLHGSVIEVHAFNAACIAFSFYSALRWWSHQSDTPGVSRWFWFTWIAASLALSQVQTAIFIFPSLLWILGLGIAKASNKSAYKKWYTWLLAVIAFGATFALSLIILYIFNSRQPEISWRFTQSLSGVWRILMRQDYAGYFIDEGVTRHAYFGNFIHRFIPAQRMYGEIMLDGLGWPLVFLTGIGIVFLLRQNLRIAAPLLLAFFLTGPFLVGYMQLDIRRDPQNLEYQLEMGIAERQTVPHHVMAGLFAVFGLYVVCTELKKRLPHSPVATGSAILLLGLITLAQIVQNWRVGWQRPPIVAAYAESILAGVPANSVIICSSDIACYSLFYVSLVEKKRPDVTVLTKNNLYRKYFVDRHPEYYGMVYSENPFFYAYLVAVNVGKRPTYLTNPDTFYNEYIGVMGNPFYLVPEGYIFRVTTKRPETFTLGDYSASDILLTTKPASKDYWSQGLYDYFSNIHNFAGRLYAQYGQKDLARTMFEYSLSLKPDYHETIAWLDHLPLATPEEAIYLKDSDQSFEYYQNLALKSFTGGQHSDAYDAARKASYLNPASVDIHWLLAELYENNHYGDSAQDEYRQILLLDPNHASASNRLRK